MFSNDTFEHCIEPHKVLAYMSDHLRINGLFYIGLAFTISDIPYHLRQNHRLFGNGNVYGNEKWLDYVKATGLEPHKNSIYRDGNVPTLFVKKYPVNWSKFDF